MLFMNSFNLILLHWMPFLILLPTTEPLISAVPTVSNFWSSGVENVLKLVVIFVNIIIIYLVMDVAGETTQSVVIFH